MHIVAGYYDEICTRLLQVLTGMKNHFTGGRFILTLDHRVNISLAIQAFQSDFC